MPPVIIFCLALTEPAISAVSTCLHNLGRGIVSSCIIKTNANPIRFWTLLVSVGFDNETFLSVQSHRSNSETIKANIVRPNFLSCNVKGHNGRENAILS